MRFDTMARASAYKVMSVSSTSTFSPLSTAKYSAAVSAMSERQTLHGRILGRVDERHDAAERAGVTPKTDLRRRKSSFVGHPPRMILSAPARRAALAITAL